MKCMFCGGQMDKKTEPYSVDRKGYHLYIREVPSYVCSQCSEKYIDESGVDEIQKMIQDLEQHLEKLRATSPS